MGCKPKTNVSIANPTPPITPRPIPPRRAPIIIAVRTNANCNICLLYTYLPAEYRDIELLDDYLVEDRPDGVQLQIAYDGRILNKNVYHDVTSLDYDTRCV